MATWRQALEVVMTDEDVARLTALSRSRTEPASRVQRAQMLLAYRENPSFFAVGQRVGVHHQTVQRCIERRAASLYRNRSPVSLSGCRRHTQRRGGRLRTRVVQASGALRTEMERERDLDFYFDRFRSVSVPLFTAWYLIQPFLSNTSGTWRSACL